jgi:hypothetical protein
MLTRALLVALSVVVLASFAASRIQTSGGSVDVRDIVLPTQNGQWLAADLFKPKTATSKNPAPLVVVVPGFQRSKEGLQNVAIELARRGMAAIVIDPYAQGRSSASMSTRAATTEGYGLFAVVDYAASTPNLNYVDKSRIGASGHSAGGNAAILAGSHFGRQADRAGEPSKLHSVFVSGYLLTLTDKVLKDVHSNIGASYAFYDEGSYRNELGNADMRRAPEALRLVRSGTGAPIDEVEIGRYYGDLADRTLRVVHNEHVIHPIQPYDREAIAHQIEFFERVFGVRSGLDSRDQIWQWKELLGLVALVAALVALVPLARLLLTTAPFRSLAHSLPPALPPPRGRGRLLFHSLLALGALIACFTYIPLAELSQVLFAAASEREQTWFFPQRMNNAVMLWAVLNGLVGFLLFFLSYRFHGRAQGVRSEVWGARTDVREILRTLLLALTLFASFYLLLFTAYWIFHVDYNFLFMGVRVFRPALLGLLCMYAPWMFVFFIANSLRVNGAMRFEGQAEWRSMLVAGIANALGLLLIVLVQYATLARTGTVYWTDGWLYVNLLFGVVPIMFVLPYFNRLFFRMTGRIYLGPMTMCLVFVMILISNTVVYIPL